MERKNILAVYHYIRSFKITFNSDFIRLEGTSLFIIIFVPCGIKKNTFFHLIVIFHPCEIPQARKEGDCFLHRARQEQRKNCNIMRQFPQSTFGGVQWTTFSAYGWAKKLNPTTAIKIQINNLVMSLAGNFCLQFHTCISSEALCVWFVFSFTAIVIPQPLVIAGRRLQNDESLATSPIKVLQLQLPPLLQSSTSFAAFMQVPQRFCRNTVHCAVPTQSSALTDHKCICKFSVKL